jgi:hypothetical protein
MIAVVQKGEAKGGLFGGSLREVTVLVPEGAPGAELELVIGLEVNGHVKIASAEVWVRCVEHARVQQGDTHAHESVVVHQQHHPLALPEALDASMVTRLKIRVPADAAPAMPGALQNEVEVVLKSPWHPALSARAPLEVLPPSMPRLVDAAPSPLDSELEVWSTITGQRFRPGDTVSGEVKIMPVSKAQHAKAIVVRLTALAHGWGEDNRHVYAQAQLADGPFTDERVIPFSLALPRNAPLTYRGQNVDIDWYVEAELLDTPGIAPRSHTPFVVG